MSLELLKSLRLLPLVLALALPGVARAGEEGPPAAAAAPAKAKGLLVDLGNAKCPIMGGKVDGESYSEWNGLRIGHCCPGCAGELAKDPATVLDRAKIAWKEAAEAVKKVNESHGDARAKALAELKAKWTVVREPEPEGLLVNLGNAKCPIMGGRVDGESYSEWNGLRIGHCCPGCAEELAKDPAAALDRAKIAWKEAAEAVKKVNESHGEARAKALAELKAKWMVAREPVPEPAPETGAE